MPTMFRDNSPFGNDSISYADSVQSSRFSMMDGESVQSSILSRPSAKSIYLQRKDYAASVNKVMDTSQYRVEHLFTCEMNAVELRTLADCVERLKLLEETGRLWGQNMLLEVCGPMLLLTDIETKMELESVHVSDIVEVKAVPNTGVFSSLLTICVQTGGKHGTTVFMFQCEDVKAPVVEKDLARALAARRNHPGYRNGAPQKSMFMTPDIENSDYPELRGYSPYEEEGGPILRPLTSEELSRTEPYTQLDKKVDILNHLLGDIEIFVGQLSAVAAQSAKKKKKKKKLAKITPNAADFASCLKKFKCAFNILAEVDGQIDNPTSTEFIHMLFPTLGFVVAHSPDGLPQTVVTPLLLPEFVHTMSKEVTEEEYKLWQFLGDAWNIPSNEWPGDEKVISTYSLDFSDGWQPPKLSAAFDSREPSRRRTSAKLRPTPHDLHSDKAKQREMLALYDFNSRNNKEITVRKGDIVELLDKTNQWWKVRDSRGEEGYIPHNVLKPNEEEPVPYYRDSVRLTKNSQPPEVKAWLELKGFREITVRCLAGLSGSSLLNMTREELKTVCPEESGRVFFQLQAVRSSLALDS